jgi:hypothetical protein
MEPDICPPYWPELLWWLFHHHHPIPGPDPDPWPIDKQLMNELDAHFAAIAVAGLAGRLGDKRVREEVGKLAGHLASNPMPGLGQLSRVA